MCFSALEEDSCDDALWFAGQPRLPDLPQVGHNFGVRKYQPAGENVRGTRVNIQRGAYHSYQIPVGAGVMRISAEGIYYGFGDRSRAYGLIQMGYGRMRNFQVNHCTVLHPVDGRDYYFYESIQSLATPTARRLSALCEFRDLAPLNQTHLYSVYRRALESSLTTWRGNFDGVLFHERDVRFDAAKLGLVGGEFVSSNWQLPDGDMFGCFGCSNPSPKGLIPWQFTTSAGSAGWTNISPDATTVRNDDRAWLISDFSPTGFVIRHFCSGRIAGCGGS